VFIMPKFQVDSLVLFQKKNLGFVRKIRQSYWGCCVVRKKDNRYEEEEFFLA